MEPAQRADPARPHRFVIPASPQWCHDRCWSFTPWLRPFALLVRAIFFSSALAAVWARFNNGCGSKTRPASYSSLAISRRLPNLMWRVVLARTC